MINNNKRSAPHVIFLVNVVEPDIETIQHSILNILLYFLDCVDKRTTWGYRFFTSSSAASISTANQPFRPISVSALEKFKQELLQQQHVTTTTTTDAAAVVAPFEIIKRVLIQSIAEFHWTDSNLSSESPRRQQQPQRKQSVVDVKNFIYLVTPLPQTYTNWEENKYIPTAPIASPSSSSLPSSGIALGLRFMHTEFRRSLWDSYIENRISLSWVDTSTHLSDDVQEAEALYNGMNAVLRPFGGSYMRASNLTADYNSYGVSFASMFHNWNARTIRVVSKEAAIPRTDEELLQSNNNDNNADTKEATASTTMSCCSVQLLFTPQTAPIQADMYPVRKSITGTIPVDVKQIDVLCAVYRSQINIRSLDTEKTQLYVLFDKGNGSNELCLFGQQLKRRDAVAVVRFGDRFGILEPRMSNAVILRFLCMDFKMYDIEPEPQQHSIICGPAGTNVLDFLDIPATPTKKEKLSNLLKESKQGGQPLKLAPLSHELLNTLQAMKDR
ncbi:hypothetical protein BDB00DRAFT_244546 [Zychaea mexicana]|uniref:uncharacterized protein n=1 Tax=Zychaea mexicana TaxID=64656 RepID=UPI0022FEF6B1|nr:uncharacterized protein BDB00DRAFT_244546 [Zychaea mexicana]KAI9495358.1 hypothetical protein BDB00DRAFT_244546 [Zychaea mexicana]